MFDASPNKGKESVISEYECKKLMTSLGPITNNNLIATVNNLAESKDNKIINPFTLRYTGDELK